MVCTSKYKQNTGLLNHILYLIMFYLDPVYCPDRRPGGPRARGPRLRLRPLRACPLQQLPQLARSVHPLRLLHLLRVPRQEVRWSRARIWIRLPCLRIPCLRIPCCSLPWCCWTPHWYQLCGQVPPGTQGQEGGRGRAWGWGLPRLRIWIPQSLWIRVPQSLRIWWIPQCLRIWRIRIRKVNVGYVD